MASLKNIGVLLSGRGSNFMAIAESVRTGKIPARIAVVISNRSDAPGIEHARKLGLDARVILSKGLVRVEYDRLVASALRECEVELVCLAGYMRLLSPVLINAFPQRILNIHPSLLPAFPGLDAQKQAVEYGVKVSGCTVHFVDEHLDHGAIVVQKTVPLHEADDDHSLAARILEQEHIAYTEAINIVLSGEYEISGRRVIVKRSQMAKAT
jgi:phosphoribosylglycinamide formyltransferase-1